MHTRLNYKLVTGYTACTEGSPASVGQWVGVMDILCVSIM